jgi:hypothetical protein
VVLAPKLVIAAASHGDTIATCRPTWGRRSPHLAGGGAAYDCAVSVSVALDELRERSAEFGAIAFLLTVTGDGRPHVVSVEVTWEHDSLVAGAGRTTAANIAGQPAVSILWSPQADGDYSLIVDGTAETQPREEATVVVIRPSRAVLHRVANAGGDGPSCVTVL